jgi:hypothetical protein
MHKYFLIILVIINFSCSNNKMQKKFTNPNQYQYQPQYYQAPVMYYQPNSRAYSNPYALPQQYATPYYDSDQYYIPPTNYYNIEKPANTGASGKL